MEDNKQTKMNLNEKNYLDYIRYNFVNATVYDPPNQESLFALSRMFTQFNIASFFKFMPLNNQYSIGNLENDIFHFSLISDLNDPAEFAYDIGIEKEIEHRKALLSCCIFVENPTEEEIKNFLTPEGKKLLDEIKEYAHVYSLTKTYNNLPMWASYADNRKGVCVEYDAYGLFAKYGWLLAPVEYVDDIPRINYDCKENEVLEYLHRICFSKSRRWSYEDEWRVLKIRYVTKEKLINDTVKPISITIGDNADSLDVARIREICLSKNIPLYRICIPEGSYEIKRELIC